MTSEGRAGMTAADGAGAGVADLTPRELDALVHERVMGKCAHTCVFEQQYDEDGEAEYEGDSQTYRCSKCRGAFSGLLYMPGTPVCPKYSSDMSAAWKVVERMQALAWGFILIDHWPLSSVGNAPICRFYRAVYPPQHHEGEWEWGNEPRAICRAALSALQAAADGGQA